MRGQREGLERNRRPTGSRPSTLLAAGLQGYGEWDATVEVVNALLARWDRPRLDVSEIRLAITP